MVETVMQIETSLKNHANDFQPKPWRAAWNREIEACLRQLSPYALPVCRRRAGRASFSAKTLSALEPWERRARNWKHWPLNIRMTGSTEFVPLIGAILISGRMSETSGF